MPNRSSRLEKIPPYLFSEIARVKGEMRARGEDVIDLGIGDPDQPTPAPIVEALRSAVGNSAYHSYDESARGLPAYLEAAAKWYEREYGVPLDAKTELLEVIGSKEGLAHLVWSFLDPGDAVIIPDPGYPVYRIQSDMCGAEIFDAKLTAANGFLPVLEDIPTDIAKRAKLFFTCYPNNPTAAVAPLSFYEDAVRFCRDHDIFLVADLAYAQVGFDGYKAPSALQVPGAKDTVIEFHSLSKPFNMTGWRIGFACGCPDAIAPLSRLKDNIDSKQFAAIADAASFALLEGDNSATLALYKTRRDALVSGLNAAGWNVEPPKATFYVWAKVPTSESSAEFAKRLLEEAKVLVIPGNGYGPSGEGYVRMSLTVNGDKNGERLAEAARRIASVALAGV
jgi:LL-diaminopimelate aminotransferase